ncbi:hypothetical protein ACFY0A_20390 [Streptomyces sp. NPDC001698]|uniref:hypothetical protein n=1 Tax=Streptomyces sp. NPDC001698 TaxID=3364601 RepID=UPI0036B7E347
MRTRIWLAAVAAAAAALTGCTSTGTSSGGSGDTKAESKPAAETKPAGAHKPEDDVKIPKCSSTDNLAGFPQAELTIENHDSRSRSYMVQVEFVDGSGTRSSEGVAMVNNLAAGQKANQKAGGLAKAPDGLKCRITKVSRH